MPARLLICYAEQFPGDKCQATHSKWRSIATVKSADVHQLPRLLALLDVSFVDRNGGNQVGSVLQSHSLGLVMHDEGSCPGGHHPDQHMAVLRKQHPDDGGEGLQEGIGVIEYPLLSPRQGGRAATDG